MKRTISKPWRRRSKPSACRRFVPASCKRAPMAGILLEASADDIVLEADAARVAGTDRSIPMAVLARSAYHQTHRFKGELAPGIAESASYDPLGTFSNACHVAVVEVDVE